MVAASYPPGEADGNQILTISRSFFISKIWVSGMDALSYEGSAMPLEKCMDNDDGAYEMYTCEPDGNPPALRVEIFSDKECMDEVEMQHYVSGHISVSEDPMGQALKEEVYLFDCITHEMPIEIDDMKYHILLLSENFE